MLATLQGIFSPDEIVTAMNDLPPLESTIMDEYFPDRPLYPSPLIGLSDLIDVVQTIPVVRRDGTPISIDPESFEAQFIAPLPVKPKVNVSASEVNDLRAFMGDSSSVDAWRRNKLEKLRLAVRATTEGISSGVLVNGKISWPIQLEGGRNELYEIDYGRPHQFTPKKKLTINSDLLEIYDMLDEMAELIHESGGGGDIEFLAGKDVSRMLIKIADNQRSTLDKSPITLKLSDGKVEIGEYVIRFMKEGYPDPLNKDKWLKKIHPKALVAVAKSSRGKVWYCAVDSISANNRAVPLHITVVQRDDDTGFTLIANAKPMPARSPRAVALAMVVE